MSVYTVVIPPPPSPPHFVPPKDLSVGEDASGLPPGRRGEFQHILPVDSRGRRPSHGGAHARRSAGRGAEPLRGAS